MKLTLLSAAVALLLPAGAGAALPRVWTGVALRVRPPAITYTGDGSRFLAGRRIRPCRAGRCVTSLRWTAYTTSQATATGADWVNDCTPDCARGRFHATAATVRLFRPRRLHGQLVFTRMRISDRNLRPRTIGLQYLGSSFSW